MSDVVIQVENLSKCYLLNHQARGRGDGLRHVLQDIVKSPIRRASQLLGQKKKGPRQEEAVTEEEFWALRDVSFEVKRGEVVGVMGRNGAGKSTLLKILSRITEPTRGRIEIDGRVASLLEVGTGFHPELTGRENIFLNGSILGMRRTEVRSKFDEIVAFAEVERFLDTPVKRYSSGMYVRLAFAVAAHLEPEILVVDEVLAVGDSHFQKKCLGKMQEVASREGRTILFVSHNMAAVANLCNRGLFLRSGSLGYEGSVCDTIQEYLNDKIEEKAEITWSTSGPAPGNERVRLCAVRVMVAGKVTSEVPIDKECDICLEYENLTDGSFLYSSIHLVDRMGIDVLASANFPSATIGRDPWAGQSFSRGIYRSCCTLPANFLNEGRYAIRVALVNRVTHVEFLTKEVVSFSVFDSGEMRKEYSGDWLGVVRPRLRWETIKL